MRTKSIFKAWSVLLSALLMIAIIPAATVSADAVGVYTFDYESDYSVYQSNCRRSTTRAHSGEYSLEMDTDLSWKMIQAPLNSGDVCGKWHTLVVDFWIYLDSAFDLSKLSESMRVYTYASSWCGAPASEQGVNFSVNEDFLGHWSHVSVTFANNGNNMKPYLYIMQCGGFGGKVYMDDVTVTTLSYGTYNGGSARTLKDAHEDYANNNIIVPSVTGGVIPTPAARSGFTFEGWYTENSHENRVTTYQAGVDTYYAKWRGTVWDGTTASSYDGGAGTAANPYRIATGAQLSKLCGSSGGATNGQYFILTDDIMLNDTSSANWRDSARGWKSTSNYLEYDFSGTFDGNGRVISGIYINNGSDNRMGGLFPSLRNTAVVENLGIVNSSITMTGANSFAGAIAGVTDGNFTITNCFVASTVDVSAAHTAAGLIGKVDSDSAKTADVENCYSLAKLNSPSNNYGLFGYFWRNYTGTVANNYTVGYDVFCNNANYTDLYSGVSNNYSNVKINNLHVHTVVSRNNMLGTAAQSNMTGFDYTGVWGTAEGKYPYLKAFGSRYAEGVVSTSAYKTHSLVLADRIGVNFFMDLSALTAEEKEASYMTFDVTKSDEELSDEFDSESVNNSGNYCFTCQLSSVQMAETVTPVFHYGEDQTVTGAPYSVKEYIDYVVAHSEQFNAVNPYVLPLVKSLGDYGHYIQVYLANGNGNNWEAGVDYTVLGKYRAADYASADYTAYLTSLNNRGVAMTKSIDGSAVTRVQYNLNFDSTTYINVVLTANETVTASAIVNDRTIRASGDGKFRTQGLTILELGNSFILSGRGKTNATGFSVTLSGLSYIRSILNSGTTSAAAKNAMASLYDYYRAACNYHDMITYGRVYDYDLSGEDVNE